MVVLPCGIDVPDLSGSECRTGRRFVCVFGLKMNDPADAVGSPNLQASLIIAGDATSGKP